MPLTSRLNLAVISAAAVSAAALQSQGATLQKADTSPFTAKVSINTEEVLRNMDPRRIGGTNVALWNEARHFKDPLLRTWVNELGTGLIRLPGGSWSNAYYWNGNGVRNEKGDVDPTRVGPDGYPAVDYSAYKPGFMADSRTLKPGTGFHGNVDIKTLHDFIAATPGAVALPSINAGTARAIDAAEWAKWAKANGYESAYWHVGNELGGSWEPGTFLPDGSTITGDLFVERFNAIADAVHQVDPKAKLGSFAFAEDILKHSGERVDFVSIHTYPGSTTLTTQQNLARIPETVAREVNQVRGWINAYQPSRKDSIELGYTEWNLSGGMNASDLFSGLWKVMMLGEFARNGVDFATQWDTFTHSRGMAAGHALIFTDGDRYTRKAGYYALRLWNHYTGDRLLKSETSSAEPLYTYASRSSEAVFILLVNPSDDREASVEVSLSGMPPNARGERVTLSSADYFWNPHTSLPEWSQSPRIHPIDTGETFTVALPPFSATFVRVPLMGAPEESPLLLAQTAEPASLPAPKLRFILPSEIYAGDRVTGYVHAYHQEGVPARLADARLSSDATVTLDRDTVRLSESLGHFEFIAGQPGSHVLKVEGPEVSASVTIEAKSSEPRPLLIWDFQKESPSDKELFNSNYRLTADLNQRPNKEVARIDLAASDFKPGDKEHKLLFRINRLPPREQLNRANIRGVFLDVRTLGLQCEDPNASVSVVLQSPADYWMVLGTFPLAGNQDWKRHQVNLTRQNHIEAVPSAYNLWFVINTSKPVTGTVLLDRIGFLVR